MAKEGCVWNEGGDEQQSEERCGPGRYSTCANAAQNDQSKELARCGIASSHEVWVCLERFNGFRTKQDKYPYTTERISI